MPIAFAQAGDDPFGFAAQLAKEKIGTPASEEIQPVPEAAYLDKVSYDPTKAKFYELFDDIKKKWSGSKSSHKRQFSFELNNEEKEVFKRYGFVVSERMGAHSFAEIYYRVYSDDLPVFVSSDSLLHAWHKCFDDILEDIETGCLRLVLGAILKAMRSNIGELATKTKATVLEKSVEDADFFIAVALSLLNDELDKGQLGQKERIQTVIDAIKEEKTAELDFFGRSREFDFSLFKPRGHYTSTKELQNYFRAMTWCGTVDLRVAGPKEAVSTRELGSSCTLFFLMQSSKDAYKMWAQFDDFLQKFIGITDSMTFEQLGAVLKSAKVTSLSDVNTEDKLVALQNYILTTDAGQQNICNNIQYSPLAATEQNVLPRAFTFMGQKFTVDSWVTSNVTYDRIKDKNGEKVQRRIPSALDVAYTVFNNEHASSELVAMMNDKKGVPFRDGLPYHQNLIALRKVISNIPESLWNSSIYFQWLATLRAMSSPMTDATTTQTSTSDSASSSSASSSSSSSGLMSFFSKGKKAANSETTEVPQVMRTKAWQDRVLNTQLASWTQLRHDTILYVKQSFTCGTECEYPEGYVDPNIPFWKQFLHMAQFTAKLLDEVELPDMTYEVERWKGYKEERHSKQLLKHAAQHFSTAFVPVITKLLAIAEKQAANQPLSVETSEKKGRYNNDSYINAMSETRFLKNVIEESHGSGATRYLGWYPSLFWRQREESGEWDPLVADVHTDAPDDTVGDAGAVLHQAVGNVNTALVTIDRGDSVVCYAGPVLSHYEFLCPMNERKSDPEWRAMLKEGKQPAYPRWTQSFLVPSDNKAQAQHYRHKDDKDAGRYVDY